MNKDKVYIKNAFMLYLLTFAKLILPIVTLPYLTRILSVESYGVTTYVKSCMSYVGIVINFGFMLSATKEIVEAGEDKTLQGNITGSVTHAKLWLCAAALVVVTIMLLLMPILHGYVLYTILSFMAVAINGLLPDFLFRGLNRMQDITYRYVVCKSASVALTLLLVKSDSDLLMIPILDLISSILAVAISYGKIKQLNIPLRFGNGFNAFKELKESTVYFISSCATTAFGALNTVVVGLCCGPEQAAYWGVSLQLILAAQSLYSPIIEGIYPHMVKTKDLRLIHKILAIFLPLILIACTGCHVFAEPILTIISGEKYAAAASVFRSLLPMLFLSFPAMLFGWPCLGALGKTKETTQGTWAGAVVQIIGIVLLLLTGGFSLIALGFLRGASEFSMLLVRSGYTYKLRKSFTYKGR